MDILLFTNNQRKAEYFSLKMSKAGHIIRMCPLLSDIHWCFRHMEPDFVLVDSETFTEPNNNYREFLKDKLRQCLLFYDIELLSNRNFPQEGLSKAQTDCIHLLTDTLKDILIHDKLTEETFTGTSPEEQLFLKQHELRPQYAIILSCLLRNFNSDIESRALIKLLWKDDSANHQQTLYAYINKLRSLLALRNVPLNIKRRIKGSYSINLIERKCEGNGLQLPRRRPGYI